MTEFLKTITLGAEGTFYEEEGCEVDVNRVIVSDVGYVLYVVNSPKRAHILFLLENGKCVCYKEEGASSFEDIYGSIRNYY